MSAHCCNHAPSANESGISPRYRKILWIALLVNLTIFLVEIGAGFSSGSTSLLADSIDFFGEAANYAVSLVVLSMALVWRSRAALVKGASMLVFGVFVLGRTGWMLMQGITPDALVMGTIGALALISNLGVAALLYA